MSGMNIQIVNMPNLRSLRNLRVTADFPYFRTTMADDIVGYGDNAMKEGAELTSRERGN